MEESVAICCHGKRRISALSHAFRFVPCNTLATRKAGFVHVVRSHANASPHGPPCPTPAAPIAFLGHASAGPMILAGRSIRPPNLLPLKCAVVWLAPERRRKHEVSERWTVASSLKAGSRCNRQKGCAGRMRAVGVPWHMLWAILFREPKSLIMLGDPS
jgi:hypothetical protein